MLIRKCVVIGMVSLLLLLAACAGGADESQPTSPPPPSQEVVALQAAQSYLEERLGKSLEGTTVAYGPAEWPDTSLGCPQDGVDYAQQVTSGYQFEITVEGEMYDLRTNADGSVVVLCPQRAESETPAGPQVIALEAARTRLTEQLGVEAVDLPGPGAAEPAEWPSHALGCPQEGVTYADEVVSGYRFQFLYDGVTYDLRASQDGGIVVLCQPGEPVPVPELPAAIQAPLDKARSLLAESLGVPLDSLELEAVTWEAVTFSSSALGCPQPGMNYLTVITEGYSFALTRAGVAHEVHTDLTGSFGVICEGKGVETEDEGAVIPLPADAPGGIVFTSYSDETQGFGISYPLGWVVEPAPAEAEVYFGPAGGDPSHGMLVSYLGGPLADADGQLSDYQIALYTSDSTAVQVGERESAGVGGRSERYSRELEGGKVVERVTFFAEGYRVLQWAPADEWSSWDDPFLQMLNSLVFNRPEPATGG